MATSLGVNHLIRDKDMYFHWGSSWFASAPLTASA
jgi:hypothetical protein